MGLVAAAAVGAVGAVGGGLIASSGAKSAAKTSAAASDAASQVQTQIYGQNREILSPYVQAGLPATQQINALLGLSPTPTTQPAYQQPNALAQFAPQQDYGNWWDNGFNGSDLVSPAGTMNYGQPWQNEQGAVPYSVNPATTVNTTPNPQSAFDAYRNSTGYQFRLNQGLNAVNSGWAGRGLLKSGAALKSLNDYGQGMASQEFGNYLNALGNQQSMGLSAAQATAGVGSNYANSLGNIAMANGANQANAALVGSQNTAGLVNSLATNTANLIGQSYYSAPKYTTTTGSAYAGVRA